MDYNKDIYPIPASIDPELARYLQNELSRMQLQIYKLREFLEPAIHNVQGTPDAVLDDWE